MTRYKWQSRGLSAHGCDDSARGARSYGSRRSDCEIVFDSRSSCSSGSLCCGQREAKVRLPFICQCLWCRAGSCRVGPRGMPLQKRLTPQSELVALPARGNW